MAILTSELACALGGRLLGEDKLIMGLSSLFDASLSDLSLVLWPKDIRVAKKSRAGVLMASLSTCADHADDMAASLIAVEDMGASIDVLYRLVVDGKLTALLTQDTRQFSREHAVIDSSARVGNAWIGCGSRVGAHVVIHDGAQIGEDCVIDAGVIIFGNAVLGKGVRIGANSVVGSKGFIPYGIDETKMLPCFGAVHINDYARVGALCTIDQGFLGATRIGRCTVLDNMVHCGHDVVIGDNVIIAAQSGFAGNVRIGHGVTIGGQVGIAPHVVVHDGARISGKSLVHCDIKKHEIWSGNPSLPHAVYLRSYGKLKRNFKDKHQ